MKRKPENNDNKLLLDNIERILNKKIEMSKEERKYRLNYLEEIDTN